jgi:hypothetical protein
MKNYWLIAGIITALTFTFSDRGWVAATMLSLYGGFIYMIGRELKPQKR